MNYPEVQILVPVHNGAQHLPECLESILAQTYPSWRAIVLDNASSDGTRRIAEEYAERDRRFSVVHCEEFVSQAQNYNRAIDLVPDETKYIKIVESDNWISGDNLARLVSVAEEDPQVGVVGSYLLMGRTAACFGLDYSTVIISGIAAGRMLLEDGVYLFGIPTSLLYRATEIRRLSPYFRPGLFYDDIDLCFRILKRAKLGWVHQVLAFQRVDNAGILSKAIDFDPFIATRYFLFEDYAEDYIPKSEIPKLRRQLKKEYFRALAFAAIVGRPSAYWEFHRKLFTFHGRKMHRSEFLLPLAQEFAKLILNPQNTLERVLSKRRKGKLEKVK